MTTGALPLTSHRVMTLIGLGLAIGAAWLGVAALHHGVGLTFETLAALCLELGSASFQLYPSILAMWLLMSIAMMLPTALPTIDLYVRLSQRMEEGRVHRIALFVAGYLVAWGAFGAVAAGAQIAIATLPATTLAPLAAAGSLMVVAGAYQLSPLKRACLDLCRNPMLFFMAHWRESLTGTLALGMRHGAVCIGCCWALMALMFIGGAMNPVWMAALGAVMLAEKVLPGAGAWGRIGGIALLGAGCVLIISTLT